MRTPTLNEEMSDTSNSTDSNDYREAIRLQRLAERTADTHRYHRAALAFERCGRKLSAQRMRDRAAHYGRLHGNKQQRIMQVVSAKAQGWRNGVPDILCLIPRRGYSYLAIELKRQDGGSGASDDQLTWITAAEQVGAYCAVCNGASEAVDVLDWYLGLTEREPYE